MNNISVVIVAKGSPKHLGECIESVVAHASEVAVLDIGLEPAARGLLDGFEKVTVHKIEKPVPYVELIREESKGYAKNEYVLFLDPDEVLPAELITRLKEEIGRADYVSIPRKNLIFGKWMKHTRWYPDYQIRFFKKNAVRWSKLIHSQPEVNGRELRLEATEKYSIVHYNYESVDEYLEKMCRYAKAEAANFLEQKQEFGLPQAFSKGISEFVSRYFAGDGYKDGMHGFVLSVLQMFYYFLVFVYYWEMKKYPEEDISRSSSQIRGFFRRGLFETNHWMKNKQIGNHGINEKLEQFFLKKNS